MIQRVVNQKMAGGNWRILQGTWVESVKKHMRINCMIIGAIAGRKYEEQHEVVLTFELILN